MNWSQRSMQRSRRFIDGAHRIEPSGSESADMPEESHPRFGTVTGIDRAAWVCSLYPVVAIWLIHMMAAMCWLLYGHRPHDFLVDDPHPQFVRDLRSLFIFVAMLCVYVSIAVLPLNAFLIMIELVQRTLHRRGGIIRLVAIPVLLWLFCFA